MYHLYQYYTCHYNFNGVVSTSSVGTVFPQYRIMHAVITSTNHVVWNPIRYDEDYERWKLSWSISNCTSRSHSLTHSRSRALLEKPAIVQLLKNSAFYGTWRFIILFTRALHWSLSLVRSIQIIPPYPISLRSILIVSTHLRLGLPSGLFPSGFPTRRTRLQNMWKYVPEKQMRCGTN
jgi:hypothetical protein